jgi:DNA-binding XRE family transcriptional regulator
MPPVIDDAVRVRVIRALLDMKSKELAERIGVSAVTITYWERGTAVPRGDHRRELESLCREHRITFLPSGMPVPFDDCLQFKEKKNG